MVERILVFQAFLWATLELERSFEIGMPVNILHQHLYVKFSRRFQTYSDLNQLLFFV